ncbi:hypothetical protein JZ751_011426 [Albula glossodonta]|uniref:Uncharacterized protein n=1 Tax=Albula glossodonta TaxID=121402 RepID=A0A8T2MK00_9TELE|nr:hypothetical protein JZ751_011426 [Albula glossodonta]
MEREREGEWEGERERGRAREKERCNKCLSMVKAAGGDDPQVCRDPVPPFDLHQVAHHHLLRVDLQLLPLPDHQRLLRGRVWGNVQLQGQSHRGQHEGENMLILGCHLDAVGQEAENGSNPEQDGEPTKQLAAKLHPLRGGGGRSQCVGPIPCQDFQGPHRQNGVSCASALVDASTRVTDCGCCFGTDPTTPPHPSLAPPRNVRDVTLTVTELKVVSSVTLGTACLSKAGLGSAKQNLHRLQRPETGLVGAVMGLLDSPSAGTEVGGAGGVGAGPGAVVGAGVAWCYTMTPVTHCLSPPSLSNQRASLFASRARKLGDFLGAPPSCPSPLVSSSSMVMSTLRPSGDPSPPSRCLCCAVVLWGGPSSLLPESYFLSLRDSCFFFSEAEAFSLDWSSAA